MTSETDDEIPVTPAPSQSHRRAGWTEARQRAFIRQLARGGSVSAAAKAVGKSARGAYALRERPGAESFADAWAMAVEMGVDSMRANIIDRALYGAMVPVLRKGKQVRVEQRFYDRMAIAVLGGRGRDIEENRVERERVRQYHRSLREEDRRRNAERKAQAERDAAFEIKRRAAEVEIAREREAGRRRAPPRVWLL